MFGFAGKKAAGYAVAKMVGRANPYVSAVILAADVAGAGWALYQVTKNINNEVKDNRQKAR